MARVEPVSKLASATPARSRKVRIFGGVTRSLVTKLILLFLVFMTVPVILYSEFRQADSEKRALLLDSVRAQGRLIAESLRPLLAREDPSPLPDLNDAVKPLAYDHAGIKILFRPASQHGLEDFFFVAAEPPVPAATGTVRAAASTEVAVWTSFGEAPVSYGLSGIASCITSPIVSSSTIPSPRFQCLVSTQRTAASPSP